MNEKPFDPYLYSLETALAALIEIDDEFDLVDIIDRLPDTLAEPHILGLALDAIRRHVMDMEKQPEEAE